MAAEIGVDERSVGRYVKTLKNAGFELASAGDESGYQIDRSRKLPPFQLKIEEVAALSLLADYLNDNIAMPGLPQARAALFKVRGMLPLSWQDEISRTSNTQAVRLSPAAPMEQDETTLHRVNEAIRKGRMLQCRYESLRVMATGQPAQPFLFAPYVLSFDTRSWYVIGRHQGYKEVRTLKLSRLTECKLVADEYTIPAGFSLKKHYGNAWRMIRGDKSYDIVLRIDKQFADTIEETQWHATQSSEPASDDGSVRLRFTVEGLDEILWWVLDKGSHCIVEEPAELVDRVKKELHASLDNYGKSRGPR